MSIEATKAVLRHSKLKGTAKLALLAIAEHADKNGLAWPGMNLLADYCNVTRQWVGKALERAKDAGELSIKYKCGPNGSNIYQINLDILSSDYVKPMQTGVSIENGGNVNNSPFNVNNSPFNVNNSLREPSRTTNEPPVTPAKPKRQPTQKQLDSNAMFSALADLTKIDLSLVTGADRGKLNQAEKKMRDNGYVPADVEAFGRWWYAHDWRGQKGQHPTLSQVRSEWGKFRAAKKQSAPKYTPAQQARFDKLKARMVAEGAI